MKPLTNTGGERESDKPSPREATSVATSMGERPCLNSERVQEKIFDQPKATTIHRHWLTQKGTKITKEMSTTGSRRYSIFFSKVLFIRVESPLLSRLQYDRIRKHKWTTGGSPFKTQSRSLWALSPWIHIAGQLKRKKRKQISTIAWTWNILSMLPNWQATLKTFSIHLWWPNALENGQNC